MPGVDVECDKTGSTDDQVDRTGGHGAGYRGPFKVLRTVRVSNCSGAEAEWRRLMEEHGLLLRGRHQAKTRDDVELVLRDEARRPLIYALMDRAAAMFPVESPLVELARQATLQEEARAEQERAILARAERERARREAAPLRAPRICASERSRGRTVPSVEAMVESGGPGAQQR